MSLPKAGWIQQKSIHTMAANMMKSSPCRLLILRIFVPILVNVARHATTRVIQLAKLTNGPRSSAVILVCDGIFCVGSQDAHYPSQKKLDLRTG